MKCHECNTGKRDGGRINCPFTGDDHGLDDECDLDWGNSIELEDKQKTPKKVKVVQSTLVAQYQRDVSGHWVDLEGAIPSPLSERTKREYDEKQTWRIIRRIITEEVVAGQRGDE